MLTFGDTDNQPKDQVCLPTGLQSLTLGFYFNQPLGDITLPNGLQPLYLGSKCSHPRKSVHMPNGSKNITLPENFTQADTLTVQNQFGVFSSPEIPNELSMGWPLRVVSCLAWGRLAFVCCTAALPFRVICISSGLSASSARFCDHGMGSTMHTTWWQLRTSRPD